MASNIKYPEDKVLYFTRFDVEDFIHSVENIINQEGSDEPLTLAQKIEEMEKIDVSSIRAP